VDAGVAMAAGIQATRCLSKAPSEVGSACIQEGIIRPIASRRRVG
jgi:hypothetical protein